MAERIGVHKNTYLKVEKGDPTVSFGIYAMALFVLGLSDVLKVVACVPHSLDIPVGTAGFSDGRTRYAHGQSNSGSETKGSTVQIG